MRLHHWLLAAAVLATAGTIAGAQVGRTPNFGDSFIRDATLPAQSAQVNAYGQLATAHIAKGAVYSGAVSSLVAASTANGDIVVIGGSATKTVRISRIIFSGQATAVGTSDVAFVKRSTVPVIGTGFTTAGVPWDSSSGAATAVLSAYTAAPTNGTKVGDIRVQQYTYANLTTGVGGPALFVQFESPVVLRGASETLSVNLPWGGPGGNKISVTVEWSED